MTHSPQLERIRQFVQQTFGQLTGETSPAVRESILVQDGQYCGRRFSSDKMQAVWFVEEGELKFYGEDGAVVKVAGTEAVVERAKRAAA